jgi:hypothetical protein
MIYLVIGLAAGIALALIALLVLSRLSGRVVLDYSGRITRSSYDKVLVAAVDEPFTERTLELAVKMAGRNGSVKTLYVAEIPVSRSLEVEAQEETARGLQALEEASLLGAGLGKRFLPAFDKTIATWSFSTCSRASGCGGPTARSPSTSRRRRDAR